MKRVLCFLVFAFIVTACAPQAQEVSNQTETPVVEVQVEEPVETPEELPVDENAASCAAVLCPVNTICENGKCIEVNQTVSAPDVGVIQKYLDEARTKFSGFAYQLDDRMVIVFDNKARHYFYKIKETKDKTPLTDIYVDLAENKAVGYCNLEREGRMVESFDYQRSKCKDYIDEPIDVAVSEDLIPKGPLEHMEAYVNLEPILVENNLQTISIGGNSKSIQPSVHFMVDGKRHVLRLDRKYHVPLKIDIEGRQAIDFRDVYFDTMVLEGKQQKIDKSWVNYQPVSDYIKQNVK